jgi:hypothetical protein
MLRIEKNTQISDENLYNIDWYVDNVDFEWEVKNETLIAKK